jgi:hypothetical protein
MRTYEEHCSFFVLGVKGEQSVRLKNASRRNCLVNFGGQDNALQAPEAANEQPAARQSICRNG